MNEISWNKSKFITKLIMLFTLILLFSIHVGISSADIEIPDIEEGDSIWAIIDVDSQGQVGVTARTNGSNNDDIKLYLYNQTHLVASDSGYNDQVSIGDLPLPAGRYTVNAYLTDAYGGGTRIISITSNRPLSLLPKYRKSAFGLVDGEANWSTLVVDKGGWIFVNAWTNGSNNDDIKLYLSNQTHLVASDSGYNDQVSIAYLAPSAGIYTVRAYLTDAHGGGTRTIFVTSNYAELEKNLFVKYSVKNPNKTSNTAPSINIESIQLINKSAGSYYIIGTASDTDGIKFIKVNGALVASSDHFNVVVTNIFYGDISIEAEDISGNITQQNIKIEINNEGVFDWKGKILDNVFSIIIVISITVIYYIFYHRKSLRDAIKIALEKILGKEK